MNVVHVSKHLPTLGSVTLLLLSYSVLTNVMCLNIYPPQAFSGVSWLMLGLSVKAMNAKRTTILFCVQNLKKQIYLRTKILNPGMRQSAPVIFKNKSLADKERKQNTHKIHRESDKHTLLRF